MKKIYLCLAAALTLGLAACSSSSDDTENKQTETTEIITPVKTAEVAFSSNGIDLATGTRAAGDLKKWDAIYRQYGPYVETNLVVNDPKNNSKNENTGDWVESSLAIHLRAAVNPTVVLGVDTSFYKKISNVIVATQIQKNKTDNYPVDVNGTTVNVAITYNPKNITVAITNMTPEALDYLEATYGDGLTVKIKNFYKTTVTRTALMEKFNSNSNISLLARTTYVVSKGYLKDASGNATTNFATGTCELSNKDATLKMKNLTEFNESLTQRIVYSVNGKTTADAGSVVQDEAK